MPRPAESRRHGATKQANSANRAFGLTDSGYLFRVPVLGLLRCDRASISRSKWRLLPQVAKRLPRPAAVPRDVAADIRLLKEVAKGRHPSLKTGVELRQRLAVTASTLRKNCGTEYRLARIYQQTALDEARRLTREKFVGDLELKVREAHDTLVRAFRRPSRRAILSEMERLGSKPVSRHDMLLVIGLCKRASNSGNSQKR